MSHPEPSLRGLQGSAGGVKGDAGGMLATNQEEGLQGRDLQVFCTGHLGVKDQDIRANWKWACGGLKG